MQFDAPGDKYEIYYELIKEYAEKTNAGELGMEVSLSTIDGHITKTVKVINIPTIVKPQIISGDLSRLFKAEIPVIFCGQ